MSATFEELYFISGAKDDGMSKKDFQKLLDEMQKTGWIKKGGD